MSEAWAELDGLGVDLGGRTILDGLTARIQGRCIGLLGPNGAGKTTLLNTLLGFLKPSRGRARLFGHDVARDTRAVRGLTGYMPERDSFIAGMTGVRFVRFMAELSGLAQHDALDRAHEALFSVGLGEARYRNIESYSSGMKQLVKLAQAIAHTPRLLLLDEPTNGLDAPGRERMLALIRDLRDEGSTRFVVSSHLLPDVEAVCDEVVLIKDGRIANHCDLAAERRSNRRFLFLKVKGDESGFANGLVKLGCEVARSEGQLKAVLPEGVDVRDLYVLAGQLSVQIRQLDHKRDSLQDIFLRTMADADHADGAR